MEPTTTYAPFAEAPARRFENARRLLRLRIELDDGRALTSDAIREMSDFRRSIMRMKPEVDLDADYARFAGFIARCPLVMRARDADGALRGTFVARWIDGETEGRRWRLILPEYGFFHPSLRGTGAFPYAVLRAMLSRPGVFVGREILLGGVGYPTGVLAVDGFFGPARFLSDPDLDPLSRELLLRIITEVAGDRFDPATGCVAMPTRPPRPGPRWFARMASRPTFARYAARCPNWLDGYALPALLRIEARGVVGALARALRRTAAARWSTEHP